MTEIKLKGYETILPNEVYSRKRRNYCIEGKKFPVTELLTLAKFQIPTRKEVDEFIKEKAKIILSKGSEKTRTYCALDNISETNVRAIIDNANNPSLFHYTKPIFKESTTCMQLKIGTVSNTCLDVMGLMGVDNERQIYDFAVDTMELDSFTIWLSLQSNGTIPDRSELELLLSRGVRHSDVLYVIECDDYSYKRMAKKFRALSEAFDSKDKIRRIRDYSDEVLDMVSAKAIEGTFEEKSPQLITRRREDQW